MHGAKSVAAMALLGLASAAPASLPSTVPQNMQPGQPGQPAQQGSFKVTNEPTGNMIPRDGMAAVLKAYQKHNIEIPEGWVVEPASTGSDATGGATTQSKAANAQSNGQAASNAATGGGAQTGQVAANSVKNDVEYTSVISIGGQQISMDFDTGSSDLWVLNTNTPASMTAGHTLYSKTKNFQQQQGATFSVSYGDSSFAQGSTVGTEVVNIGGAVVQNQVIELADRVGQEFVQDTSSNGLVGLAFSKLNTVKPAPAKTFFENVAPQLASPVFTANLKHAATGAYEFGKIDTTQFTGQMAWVPVNSASGFWQFDSQYFSVGGNQLLQNTQASPAIADTGTSLLLMDPGVVQTYYSAVPGAGQAGQTAGGAGTFVFPNTAKLPDLQISAGGTQNMLKIPGSLLAYTAFNSTHMFGGLQSNQGAGVQILGDVLFKSQFVAFDLGQTRLGFAPHAN